jgi:tetratricopeptide (TPR) repeat protein
MIGSISRQAALGLLALLGAGGAFILLYAFFWRPTLDPPVVDWAGVDPAVRQAIEAEQENVRQSPRSGAAWGRLGMILVTHMFADEALPCFVEAERRQRDNPRWPYHQGLILLAHDSAAALPKVIRAVELCQDETDGPRLCLAKLYLTLGQQEQARQQFVAMLQKQRGHPRAHLGLARLDAQAERWAAARKHLNYAVNDDRTCKAALTLSAEVYQRQGDGETAQQEQARRLQLPDRPDWPDAYVEESARLQVGEEAQLRLAATLLDNGRGGEARAVLKQILQDYPRSTRAWLELSFEQLSEGDLAAADRSLDAVLALDPSLAKAWLYRGTIRFKEKEHTEAIACYRKAIECKSTYLEGHYNLGVCLKEVGNLQAALNAFQSAVRCQPLSAPAHANLGALLLEQGQKEQAVFHLQQAITLNPGDSNSRKLLEATRAPGVPPKN